MARARKSRSAKAATKTVNVRQLKPLMVAIKRVLDDVNRRKSAESSPAIDQLQAEYDAMEECCCQRAHVVAFDFKK